jgi:protein-L-isoaspartate O-methyltransferase
MAASLAQDDEGERRSLDDDEEEWRAPFGNDGEDDRSLAPFATTPPARIVEMIQMAKVGKEDVVCDLGAGDGSVLSLCWEHCKASRAIGFEINNDLVQTAQQTLRDVGCPASYSIVNQDVMTVDLSPFTVIFTWLQPWAVDMLAEKLADAIATHGARVVSYQWPIAHLGRSFHESVGVTENMYLYQREAPSGGDETAATTER